MRKTFSDGFVKIEMLEKELDTVGNCPNQSVESRDKQVVIHVQTILQEL